MLSSMRAHQVHRAIASGSQNSRIISAATRPCLRSSRNHRNIVASSSEEGNATETMDNIASEQKMSDTEVLGDDSSSISKLRKLLQSEGELDRAALLAAVNAIDEEVQAISEEAGSAEVRTLSSEATLATLKDQYLRLNADFDNFRRRTKDEKDVLKDNIRGDIVTSLLPVVDNFELARTQVKAETDGEHKINNSYQGLYKQFVDFLRGLGVEAVATVGQPFDPNFHEAIMKEANNEVPDGTVLIEFRKGFKIGNSLLRPAMVKVSENDGSVTPIASSEE